MDAQPRLIRAMLVLEYADGQVHSFTSEDPASAEAKLDYAEQVFPDLHDYFDASPEYLGQLGSVGPATGVTLRIKAGLGTPLVYRND